MSGRTKRTIYYMCDGALWLVLGGGMFCMAFYEPLREKNMGWEEFAALNAALLCLILKLPVLLHECGHLLFGLAAGMKLASFHISPLLFGKTAGATAMYPKNGRRVKEKFFLYTLGGAVCNLLIGLALFLLWLLLPYHPALAFAGTISGFIFYEGVRALLPAELAAGKTDGAVLSGLGKGAPEEEISLRVLTAQGILFCGSFQMIDRGLLFDVPVVREDLHAFHALLFLRMQYLLSEGDREGAHEVLDRLFSLSEFLTEEELAELERYAALYRGEFQAKDSPFAGVRALEEVLQST